MIKRLLIYCWCFFEIFLFTKQIVAQTYSTKKVDSLLQLLPTLASDTQKVKVLYDISYGYQTYNPKQGIEFGLKAISLADSLNFLRGMATSNAMVGLNYAAMGDYKNALQFQTASIKFYQETGNKKSEAAMLTNIGNIFSNQSNYIKALDYCYGALKIYENLQLEIHKAFTHDNIGNIFFRQKDHNRALKHYVIAEKIYLDNKYQQGLGRNYGNQGMVYHELKEFDKAIELQKKALQINIDDGNKRGIQINKTNLANVYLSQHQFEMAIEHYQEALAINEEIGNMAGIATTLGNIGIAYFEVSKSKMPYENYIFNPKYSDINLAIKFLTNAIEKCQNLGLLHPMADFSKTLSQSHELIGNFKESIKYLKLHQQYTDSVNSVEIKQQIASLEIARQLDLKEKDLLLKDQEIQIKQLEIERNRFLLGFYILITIVSLIIIIILWRNNQKHKTKSLSLLKENELHVKKINNQLDDLKKHSKVLSEIAYMQAHHVRGPVSTLLGFIDLFNKKNTNDPINKFIIENMEEVITKLDEAVKTVVMKENELKNQNKNPDKN